MYKAVIIDDDLTTVNGLKKSVNWLEHNIEVVGTAPNGSEGLKQIEECQPDIILTDIYMPIMNGIEMLQNLRQQGNTAEVLILSGYEDFHYAKTALKLQVNDYLSKPATLEEINCVLKSMVEKVRKKSENETEDRELRNLLENNKPLAKKQLLKRLLETGDLQQSFSDKLLKYLHLDLSDQVFTVVIIEFYKNSSLYLCKPSEWTLFEYAVNNIINELAQTQKGLYIADNQCNMITFILSSPKQMRKEDVQKHARTITNQFMQAIQQFLKLQVWAAIGPTIESADRIHFSCNEAKNLLAEREYRIDQRLTWKEPGEDPPRASPKRPVEYYQPIINSIMLGQTESVQRKIQELIGAMRSMQDLSVYALRDYVIDFMGLLAVALYDHGLRIEDFFPSFNLYRQLESLYTIEDLAGWLSGVAIPICDMMDAKSTQKHKKKIDFIIRYVEEHYAEDFTLDTLADKVFLTRNYLSQIFKQATGENFNNFVTKVRMEKAKELMLSGHYKLYEISHKVGYKNTAYFSQLFKKYTGFIPSEFNQ